MPQLSGETLPGGAPTGGNIRFRKCPLCGLEYPEEARVCRVDDSLLELWGYPSTTSPSLGPLLFAIQMMARYILALVVSFIASFVTFFLVGMLLMSGAGLFSGWLPVFGVGLILLVFAVAGFAGVLSGGFCLPWRSRVFGSVFLLLCGLIWSVYLLATMRLIGGNHGAPHFPSDWLVSLAGGGALAVAFFWRRSRKIPPGERRPLHEAVRLSASWPVDY